MMRSPLWVERISSQCNAIRARPSLYLRKSQDLQYHAKHTREEMDKEVWRELKDKCDKSSELQLVTKEASVLDFDSNTFGSP